jgi:hypothetical protein
MCESCFRGLAIDPLEQRMTLPKKHTEKPPSARTQEPPELCSMMRSTLALSGRFVVNPFS